MNVFGVLVWASRPPHRRPQAPWKAWEGYWEALRGPENLENLENLPHPAYSSSQSEPAQFRRTILEPRERMKLIQMKGSSFQTEKNLKFENLPDPASRNPKASLLF